MADLFGRKRLPVYLQAESAECGLACLAMIASSHGHECSVFSLRERFGSSAHGANLQKLMNQADQLELSARPLRAEVEELNELRLPAILHWNFNHFVVLKKIVGGKAVIHDPAVGARNYTLRELGRHFTGIVLELGPRLKFETGKLKRLLSIQDFFKGLRGLTGMLVQLFVLSLLIQVIALVSPFYMQLVVDEVVGKVDRDLLLVLALGFLGLSVFSVFMQYARGLCAIYLTSQLSYHTGNSIMHHLMRLPMTFFSRRHLGDVISRFESFSPIQGFISSSTVAIVLDGLLAITTLVMMLIYSTSLTMVVVVSSLLYTVFRACQYHPLRAQNLESVAARATLDSHFIESIRALRSIKLAGKEQERQSRWKQKYADSVGAESRIGRLTVSYEAIASLLVGVEQVLVVFLGARQVLDGVLTIGMVYAFMAYRGSFSNAITSIINQVFAYKMLSLHLERLSDITGTEQEAGLQDSHVVRFPLRGELTLKAGGFAYEKDGPMVFENLDLHLPEGGWCAIFGPSGIGKSTLLNVLMGLEKPTTGELLVDGRVLNASNQASYRQAIAGVTQADSLLSGSILDNISFFELTPDMARVRQAAELTRIHGDITALPMQYDSLIGDMGTALSQGQLQRIMLARALYRQPRLLFLDEGTAFLDHDTESQVFHNIRQLDMSCVFVTHNPALLKFADRVIKWHPIEGIQMEKKGGAKSHSRPMPSQQPRGSTNR
ncbi:MAG: peptidase domain-containing ABC transporter [Pseudohongiellaceae bacterium]